MQPVVQTEASKEGRVSATIIQKKDVVLIRKIGEGAHGSVHEGTWGDIHGAVSRGGVEVDREGNDKGYVWEGVEGG
jgi:hypothetical protein